MVDYPLFWKTDDVVICKHVDSRLVSRGSLVPVTWIHDLLLTVLKNGWSWNIHNPMIWIHDWLLEEKMILKHTQPHDLNLWLITRGTDDPETYTTPWSGGVSKIQWIGGFDSTMGLNFQLNVGMILSVMISTISLEHFLSHLQLTIWVG